MIYVAHPYTNDPAGNMAKVEAKLQALKEANPRKTYISPLHTFSWQAGVFSWDQAMDDCSALLRRCNSAYFCQGWENSRGCSIEMDICVRFGIPYTIEPAEATA